MAPQNAARQDLRAALSSRIALRPSIRFNMVRDLLSKIHLNLRSQTGISHNTTFHSRPGDKAIGLLDNLSVVSCLNQRTYKEKYFEKISDETC